MPELGGKWLGKIIYGPSFGELENETLFFTLDLLKKGDVFSGVSRDVGGVGINPGPALVNGFTENGVINFVKQYSVSAEPDINQKLATGETKPCPEISFTGSFDSSTGEYSGEWIILISHTVLGNVFFEKNNGGLWSMRREDF